MQKRKQIMPAAFFLLLAANIWADNSQINFQISPPPIPYPNFELGRKDTKTEFNYFNISGDNVSFNCVGINMATRRVISADTAVSGDLGFSVGKGEMNFGGYNLNPTLLTMNISGVFEYQLAKKEYFDLIMWLGLTMPLTFISFDEYYTLNDVSITPISLSTIVLGVPFGLQADIKAGFFRIAPFCQCTAYAGGTASLTYTGDVYTGTPSSYDIDPYTTVCYGLDIIFMPLNISLSSLVQLVDKLGSDSSADSDIRTFSIQLAWRSTEFKK